MTRIGAWIASIYEERDSALARSRELEKLAEVQDLDLQHAASTIKSLSKHYQITLHQRRIKVG